MSDRTRFFLVLGCLSVVVTALTPPPAALAQKIICWKDKSGKVIGCGDRVPPEFRENEAKVLDKSGIPRGTRVSAEEAARLKEEERKKAAEKAAEDRRLAEQRRQDSALVNTYTSGKEIDQRRDRELQVVELQITQIKASLKSATDAHAAVQKRHDEFARTGKPVPDAVRDELARATEEKNRVESRIAEKEKDKGRITASYAQQKARYFELKGIPAETAGAAPAAKKQP